MLFASVHGDLCRLRHICYRDQNRDRTVTKTGTRFSQQMTDDLARSLEQISVGAGTFQVKEFIIRSINQQPVWGNVTFAVMLPVPRKGMISVSDRQNFLEL